LASVTEEIANGSLLKQAENRKPGVQPPSEKSALRTTPDIPRHHPVVALEKLGDVRQLQPLLAA
jgi:hypothetical protein